MPDRPGDRWRINVARAWRDLPTWHLVAAPAALTAMIGGFILELAVKPHLIGSTTLLAGTALNLYLIAWRMMHQANGYKWPRKVR